MSELKIENYTSTKFVGKYLLREIYRAAARLDADYIEINKCKYNSYAEIALFWRGNCISWSYTVSV